MIWKVIDICFATCAVLATCAFALMVYSMFKSVVLT
jgi:hypothetical protein